MGPLYEGISVIDLLPLHALRAQLSKSVAQKAHAPCFIHRTLEQTSSCDSQNTL